MRARGFLWVTLLLASGASAESLKFMPDDPVRVDVDNLPVPQPAPSAVSKAYDFLENTFAKRGGRESGPALNVNSLGEVPDSSWFANRLGQRSMSLEEIARGPNRGSGPSVDGAWTVLSLKTEGITPGFLVRDARGDRYLVKLDPLNYAQMTTSSEVISTKIFHAIGYHVPENYLAFLDRDRLLIDESAVVTDSTGRRRPLRESDLNRLIDLAPLRSDGRVQVLASRFLAGKPLGPFKFFGTRTDDPNDIFPHEDRRELRGLRIFAAWLNHNDSDAANTLDVYVGAGQGGHVKHYLIDFGTTLGSGGFEPHSKRAGNEHYLQWGPVLKSSVTFGLWDRPWRSIPYTEFPSIGRFESAHFQPEQWKPDYPNPAFDRMDAGDAFWAVSILARFTDERLEAIVATGDLTDPLAEAHLLHTLKERRDKILRTYLAKAAPLGSFSLDTRASALVFENLGVEWSLGTVEEYRFQWFGMDEHGALEPLGAPSSTVSPVLPLPRDGSPFWMARIETLSPEEPHWRRPVTVYIRNRGVKTVVGVARTFE